MGCGSSSLKGAPLQSFDPAPQPIKKVQTNFSSIDYSSGASTKRRFTEAAPEDLPRTPSQSVAETRAADTEKADGAHLAPYQSPSHIEDADIINRAYPHEQPTQTTTDPAIMTRDSIPTSTTSSETKERKKSWFGKQYASYQHYKTGRNVDGTPKYTDEDLKKFTGMDRAELEKFAATTPGVAGNQNAGSLTAGPTSGLYAGGYTTFDGHRTPEIRHG